MKDKKINKNTLILIFIIILETIIIKSLQYKILPSKYFFDSYKILSSMGLSINYDKSYNYVISIFEKINFFHFATLQQWSIFITLIFTPIIIYYILKNKKYKLHQTIFIIASVALLDLYVFNLSKDIIQFIYFLLLFLILKSKFNNMTKLVLSCVILLYEALNFRIYYALMAMIMVTIYIFYNIFIKTKILNKKDAIKIVLLFIVAFFIEVFFAEIISTNNYEAILNARYSVNVYRQGSLDAVTIINDVLGRNTNFITFVLNYLINFIRMNIPLELLFKGIKYFPFIIFQIYIIIQLKKGIKELNDNNVLLIATILSFIMISVIFEPDFGSFIRHESTMLLILLELTFVTNQGRCI